MATLTSALLFLIIGGSIYSYKPGPLQNPSIETIGPLQLTDENATKVAIGSYMVNRKSRSTIMYQVFSADELNELNITVKLGDINTVNKIWEKGGQNKFTSSTRYFEASLIYGPYDAYDKVFGRIDQNMNVFEKRTSESRPFNYSRIWGPHAFLNDQYCISKFVNVTSESGYEYWDIKIGNIQVSNYSKSEGNRIRMFSSKTKWRGSEVYWPYAGYITEELEIHFLRLS